MGYKKYFYLLRNKKGQSTVEYILLLAVVITFMTTVWNSRSFKEFFGEDSSFFTRISQKIRIDYRYAANLPIDTDNPVTPIPIHPSFSPGSGETRFFTHNGTSAYP